MGQGFNLDNGFFSATKTLDDIAMGILYFAWRIWEIFDLGGDRDVGLYEASFAFSSRGSYTRWIWSQNAQRNPARTVDRFQILGCSGLRLTHPRRASSLLGEC